MKTTSSVDAGSESDGREDVDIVGRDLHVASSRLRELTWEWESARRRAILGFVCYIIQIAAAFVLIDDVWSSSRSTSLMYPVLLTMGSGALLCWSIWYRGGISARHVFYLKLDMETFLREMYNDEDEMDGSSNGKTPSELPLFTATVENRDNIEYRSALREMLPLMMNAALDRAAALLGLIIGVQIIAMKVLVELGGRW